MGFRQYVESVLRAHDAFVYLELGEEPSAAPVPHAVVIPAINETEASSPPKSDLGVVVSAIGILLCFMGVFFLVIYSDDIAERLGGPRARCLRCVSPSTPPLPFCLVCAERACWESTADASRQSDHAKREGQAEQAWRQAALERARAESALREAQEERRRAEEVWRKASAAGGTDTKRKVRDPHELLGLPRSASSRDVKKAFHARIAENHPDKVAHLGQEIQELAAKLSRELIEAYEILREHRT